MMPCVLGSRHLTAQARRQPSDAPGALRSETLPTPDIAAALILNFGGTVESLPLDTVSSASTAREGGYLVTADSFVIIARVDGALCEMRLPDPQVDQGMMDLLVAAGGTPVSRTVGHHSPRFSRVCTALG
jgi:hypothetical protein